MRCNPTKLRSARDRRALTQEMLAIKANVNVRTVQRAEAGFPLRHETLADFAAVLGVPTANLIMSDSNTDGDRSDMAEGSATGLILKRAGTGKQVMELFETSPLIKLECGLDPNADIMETLREAIGFLERYIPDPWAVNASAGPLSFNSVLDRLDALANANSVLQRLERDGLALYCGSSFVSAIMPQYSDEGMVTRQHQPADAVRAARMVIAEYELTKLSVDLNTKWPVEIVEANEDDDVPF